MPTVWQNTYQELKNYIAKNPGIKIDKLIVSIPSDIRHDFYQLFDRVRGEFVRDNAPDSLEKGYALSKAYTKVSQAVTEELSLESIDIPASVAWFLQDPVNGLIRPLFDPLFDLLKDKTDLDAFEQVAVQLMDKAFKKFFKYGYMYWATLGIVHLLAPDKNYRVPATDFHVDPTIGDKDHTPGLREESVPEAHESNQIFLEQSVQTSFIVPKVIVHSTRLGTFVALHSDFFEALWTASMVSADVEWFEISDIKKEYGHTNLWPDLTIYKAEQLNDLTLVADYSRMMRPEIIVETIEDDDWYKKGKLEMVKRHCNILKPRLGSYVVCRDAVPQAATEELKTKSTLPAMDITSQDEIAAQPASKQAPQQMPASKPPPGIHLLSVGYDMNRLDSVVKAFLET